VILIAGAGIGGLTLAAALRREGIACQVLERASRFAPQGSGITVQPNALRALRVYGLDAMVREYAEPIAELQVRHWQGRPLSCLSGAALERAFGAPALAIHRAELHAVLLEAAGADLVRTDCEATGFREDEAGVELLLRDGSSVRGQVLVGADGLRSPVRAGLLGARPPRYAGYTSWRCVVASAPGVTPGLASESWGPGARFGIVPLPGGRTYWYATANRPAGGTDASAGALLPLFEGWHAPIPELLAASGSGILRTDIHDRPQAPRWTRGRVTLLGDAAHPMTPNLGQGGCQAIEDAVVLARELARSPTDLPRALGRYEARRREHTARVTETARRLGALGQWRLAPARAVRDALLSLPGEQAQLRQVAWLYSFEA
jgi:2-polyprenyl-6-methoxyphenol hydroxylase-like FAD-dependent oxidoreductase